jgi:hypothetical protein
MLKIMLQKSNLMLFAPIKTEKAFSLSFLHSYFMNSGGQFGAA